MKRPFHDKLNALHLALCKIKGVLYYRHIFASFGSGSVILDPLLIANPRFIHIGRNVLIRQGVRLEAVQVDGANAPEIRIGDNVNIEQNIHMVCLGKMTIGANVSITANCSLMCGSHPFLDVKNPVKIGNRLSSRNSFLEIGEGAFLGIGAIIQTNLRIGNRAIVDSGSVVKKSVPPFSVVSGNPATVKLRYDSDTDSWVGVAR